MYEDDGVTREHRNGAFAKTLIEVNKGKNIDMKINAAKGNYKGKYLKRIYILQVHAKAPSKILINKRSLKKCTASEFEKGNAGYYFNPDDKKGIVYIKTNYLPTSALQTININY